MVDTKVVELGLMDAHEIWLAADELYGEPVLPHFRLPLAALCEDIEAAEPPQQTALERRETAR